MAVVKILLFLLLLFPATAYAGPPMFFLTMLGGGVPCTNGACGQAWGDISCGEPCYEDHDCLLNESPCIAIEMNGVTFNNDHDTSGIFTYCQREDSEAPNYCVPGNCQPPFGSNTTRYYYQDSDWTAGGSSNPMFVDTCVAGATPSTWCTYNAYPLYLATGATAICNGGADPPLEWYYPNFDNNNAFVVKWYNGTTWGTAYTAGNGSVTNWDWVEPSIYGPFLSPDWVDTFISRFNSQYVTKGWKLAENVDTDLTCSCYFDYPGSLSIGADATVFIDTFANDQYWADNSTVDGGWSVSDGAMNIYSDPGSDPDSGEFGGAYNSTTLWPNPDQSLFYLTIRLKHTNAGLFADTDMFNIIYNPASTSAFRVAFASDGVFIYDQSGQCSRAAGWYEIGTDINKVCSGDTSVNGCWMEFTFKVSMTGNAGEGMGAWTFDTYVNGALVDSDNCWKIGTGAVALGTTQLRHFGYHNVGSTEVDFVDIGDGL